MTGRERASRGQAGLDRLMLFVLAVVLFLVVTPPVLGLFGIDVVGGGDGESGDSEGVVVAGEADGAIQILGARGTDIDTEAGTVGTVELTVAPGATDGAVDLQRFSMQWLSDRSYHLLPEGTEGGDGTFAYDQRELRESGNTTTIRVDVAGTDAFEGPLVAGQTVTVVLIGPEGENVEYGLTVPEQLPAASSVSL